MDKSHVLKFLNDEVKEKLVELIDNDLQFVEVPKEILCSSCGSIPLFHFIYPCLHPYCRECFKNVFQKLNKKCKVCKEDLGSRFLQNTSIEQTIYNLKAICPNKNYGCKDVVELSKLLEHLEECQHSEENHNKLQSAENYLNKDNAQQNRKEDTTDLKISVSKILIKLEDLTLSNHILTIQQEYLLQDNERLNETIRQMSVENQKILFDLKEVQNYNISVNKNINQIKEKVKGINYKSKYQDSIVDIDVESLKMSPGISKNKPHKDSKLTAEKQETSDSGLICEPEVMSPETIKKRFRTLENSISDMWLSQMSIKNNVKQYIRVIVAKQMIPEDDPIIKETVSNKNNEDIAFINLENDLRQMIIEDLKDFKQDINKIKKVMSDNNAEFKIQGDTFKAISDNNMANTAEFHRLRNELISLKQLTEKQTKDQINAMEGLNKDISEKIQEAKQQYGQDTDSKVEIFNNKIRLLETTKSERSNQMNRLESAVITIQNQDIVQIRQSQKDSMDAITAMKGQKNGVLIWEINEFSKKKEMASTSKDGKIDIYSDEFYSSEYGYKMKLQVQFYKNQLRVFLGFVPGEHDAHLPAVFHHNTTFYILDQSDRKEKRHVVGVIEPRFRDGQPEIWMKKYSGFQNFCNYSLLETKHEDLYLKDDRIFLKVVVEPIFPLTTSPYSNDGILLWKVLNYARTKQESQDEICKRFYSDSFYSSTHGYRMKCYLYFDEKQLDIWLFFLEGEFDDLLPDVYAHKVTFSILDQNNNSEKKNLNEVRTLYPKVIGKENAKEKMSAIVCSGAGFLFANFEKTMFLVNDTILIKVEVKPL